MPADLTFLQPYLDNAVRAAAAAAHPFVGQGDKLKIDTVAVAALRAELGRALMSGVVVIGEGEADESAHLYVGEEVGAGGVAVDIAVDPIDGTSNAAAGTPNAVSMLAISTRGTMLSAPDIKMQKIMVQPKLNITAFNLNDPWEVTLRTAAAQLGKEICDLRVCFYANDRYPDVLNRDATLLPALRAAGISPMGVPNEWPQVPALCRGEMDLILGIGGAPETVVATAALKQAGANILARFYMDAGKTYAGVDMARIYSTDDIIGGQALFAMADVTPRLELSF